MDAQSKEKTNNYRNQRLIRILKNEQVLPFMANSGWNYSLLSLTEWYNGCAPFPTDATWLETTHDYIQYILPLNTKSANNPEAGVLPISMMDPLHVNALAIYDFTNVNANEAIRLNILRGAIMMLRFFGITTIVNTKTRDITLKLENVAQSPFVKNVAQNSHNDLRMTRLVICLRLFGFHTLALNALCELNKLLEHVGRFDHIVRIGNTIMIPMANKYLAQEYTTLTVGIMPSSQILANSCNRKINEMEYDSVNLNHVKAFAEHLALEMSFNNPTPLPKPVLPIN